MAMLAIVIGSFRSVSYHQKLKSSGEMPDIASSKDAAMFPFQLSLVLLIAHTMLTQFPKEHAVGSNFVLSFCLFYLVALTLSYIFKPFNSQLVTWLFPNMSQNFIDNIINLFNFTICGTIAYWYLGNKQWLIDNLVGLTLSVMVIEEFCLNRFRIGFILLFGLLLFDVFWVFCTNVMETVARSINLPVKLVFPEDFLENGLNAKKFLIIGLGDIAIPGIFISLLLRFDMSLKCKSRVYFYSGLAAYGFGFITALLIAHLFQHGQPALLYLVPACLVLPTYVAYIKGDMAAMFQYEDYTEAEIAAAAEKEKEK